MNEGSSSTRDRNDDDDDELPLLLMLSLLLLIGALPMSCIMRRVLALKGEREEGEGGGRGKGGGGLKKNYKKYRKRHVAMFCIDAAGNCRYRSRAEAFVIT